jgi:hypothetical protein
MEKKHTRSGSGAAKVIELLESLMLSSTCVWEDCLSMATMISAISAENSGEAIKRLLAVIVAVLFNHPKRGSTLALRLDQNFGTDTICNRLATCDRRYNT